MADQGEHVEHLTDPNYWHEPYIDNLINHRGWYLYGGSDDPRYGWHDYNKPAYYGRHYFRIGDDNEPYSTDFGIQIKKELILPAPERDIEALEVQGRDGSLLLDNKRYKPIIKELKFVVRAPDEEDEDRGLKPFRGRTLHRRLREINSWIHKYPGYQEWYFSMYPKHTYYGRVVPPFSFTDVNKQRAEGVINIELKPYMDEFTWLYSIDDRPFYTVDWEGDLPIRPYIEIPNAVDLDDFKIHRTDTGEVWLHLKAKYPGEINGTIRIDCEKRTLTKNGVPSNWLLQHDEDFFPYINPGERFGLATRSLSGGEAPVLSQNASIYWSVRRLVL